MQANEFVGTAAAEKDVHVSSEDLFGVIGLDRDRWSILAIDLNGGTSSTRGRDEVTVDALDRVKHGIVKHGIYSHDALLRLAAEREGVLPVTNFLVHGVAADRIVSKVFKRYQVRLLSRSAAGNTLHVEARDDLLLND
ncbi:hypothetical protein C5C31_01040 [Rathayibacter rathayi]|nr:hypothetical protein C5C02_01325 [Rathayibacter rathayi]PPG78933.1 hypothetical protein C5C23_00495 [Rathayibacter rathayi]PPH26417.1 hypothetical protein C5C31_01040 [Rathayibacter rathayi]PPI76717.1 hypothetical protein C5E03_08420 [Rathayibacter rathayi]